MLRRAPRRTARSARSHAQRAKRASMARTRARLGIGTSEHAGTLPVPDEPCSRKPLSASASVPASVPAPAPASAPASVPASAPVPASAAARPPFAKVPSAIP